MKVPDDLQDSQLMDKWRGTRGSFKQTTLSAAKKLLPEIWPYLDGHPSLRAGNNRMFHSGLGSTPSFNTILERVRAAALPVFKQRQARAAQKAQNKKRKEAAKEAEKVFTARGF